MTILDSSTGAAARRVDPWLTSRVSRPTCAEPAVRSAKDRFEINSRVIMLHRSRPRCARFASPGARPTSKPAYEIPGRELVTPPRPGEPSSIG